MVVEEVQSVELVNDDDDDDDDDGVGALIDQEQNKKQKYDDCDSVCRVVAASTAR